MRERAQRFNPRQHMHTKNYEVFHYRDTSLEPVALHHHDFFEIYFFLGGQVEYHVEGNSYRMEPGDLLLISPMELHRPLIQSDSTPYERIVLWINRSYLESLSSPPVVLTRCFNSALPTHTNLLRLTPVQRTSVAAKINELVRESYSTEYGAALWASSSFLQLMIELNRIALQSSESRPPQQSPSLVSSVLEYIGEHYYEPLTLEQLAQRFYVSKYHLSHEFNRAVGTSVYHYVILKRLLIAKQLLSSGASPGAVSQSCGFGDYANFYRAFKAEYGVSPSAYAGGET